MGSRVVAIIPARYESTRLPGKPLADLHGRPMIQHVYERALRAHGVDRVLVATDSEQIRAAVHGFGGDVVLTGEHRTGTELEQCAYIHPRMTEHGRDFDRHVEHRFQIGGAAVGE